MSKSRTNVAKFNLAKRAVHSIPSLQQKIIVIRGQRVMLDRDLAELYGVTTKRLNEQLKRNHHRFPKDFAFRLTLAEAKDMAVLRSQFATLKRGQHVKHSPHVFTEHGAIMLASVLNSRTAVQASIYIVRAFVQMRTTLMEYAHLSRRIDALEKAYDHRFKMVFDAIRALIAEPEKPRRIGFVPAPRR